MCKSLHIKLILALSLILVFADVAKTQPTGSANRVIGGYTLPTRCSYAGDIFNLLNANLRTSAIYQCTADNTWTLLGGGGGSGVSSLAVGTAGTDVAVSAATGAVTLNIPTASAVNRGVLSSADWSTFNNKEPACPTCVKTGQANTYGSFAQDFTLATVSLPTIYARTTVGFTMSAGQQITGVGNGSTAPFRGLGGTFTEVNAAAFGFNNVNSYCWANGVDHLCLTNPATALRTWAFQDSSDTVVGRATTDTLTNKSISGATNTFSAVPGSVLNAATVTAAKMASTTWDAQTDAATITWAIASVLNAQATVTLGGNRTLNITNPVVGGNYVFKITQDGTGTRTLTKGTGCTWKELGSSAATFGLSTAANAIDIVTFTYDGTNCLATVGKAFGG